MEVTQPVYPAATGCHLVLESQMGKTQFLENTGNLTMWSAGKTGL